MWLQFWSTFCRGSKRPLVYEPSRLKKLSFLFLLTSSNEKNFKGFSLCPLQEDILKNLKVFKFQLYIWVSRKFRDERKKSLLRFFKCVFYLSLKTFSIPIFEFLFVWATLEFKWQFMVKWKHNDTVTGSPLSPPRAQANNLINNLRVTPTMV